MSTGEELPGPDGLSSGRAATPRATGTSTHRGTRIPIAVRTGVGPRPALAQHALISKRHRSQAPRQMRAWRAGRRSRTPWTRPAGRILGGATDGTFAVRNPVPQ